MTKKQFKRLMNSIGNDYTQYAPLMDYLDAKQQEKSGKPAPNTVGFWKKLIRSEIRNALKSDRI